MEMSLASAGCMLVAACVLLGGLYALIRAGFQIVFLIFALYFFGATSAVATVVVRPQLARYFPSSEKMIIIDSPSWGLHYSLARLASLCCGAVVAATFLVFRRASWAWVLQDGLGALLCCLFLATIRVNSLRTATIMLSAFFFYGARCVLVYLISDH